VLALTDQFPQHASAGLSARARSWRAGSPIPTSASTTRGIIHERRAKAALQRDLVPRVRVGRGWLHEALACFERAESLKPAHNDDAVPALERSARAMLQKLPQVVVDTHAEPIESE
jgi:hypothetical protein